ncbi:phage major capsid family protein [Schaalia turicensis]|uniref:phage major capsid family protein n=1 Tax=Schaalia turicensis TaxID=131111 RepID=UPI0018983B86|nr:phage major capsid protein [Schaalia turicensis]
MGKLFTSENAKPLLPREIADGLVKNTQSLSTIAALSTREPMRFGKSDVIVFNDLPRAEFVEEGADKASTQGGFSSVTVQPHKAQVTMRFNQEVMWADEDYQLGVLNELSVAGQESLSRALDLGVYHRINPLTGNATTWENYLGATTKRVEIKDADADDDFRSAVGLLVTGATPVNVTGAAFDPKFSWSLASLKNKDGMQRYPQLGLGTGVDAFMGIKTAVGNTVSGVPEAADTKVRAIVGDFTNGIRWGVQRELPVELIQHGDPDGQGDLKRKNQVALRLEIVYGWYVFADRFAIIEDKVD